MPSVGPLPPLLCRRYESESGRSEGRGPGLGRTESAPAAKRTRVDAPGVRCVHVCFAGGGSWAVPVSLCGHACPPLWNASAHRCCLLPCRRGRARNALQPSPQLRLPQRQCFLTLQWRWTRHLATLAVARGVAGLAAGGVAAGAAGRGAVPAATPRTHPFRRQLASMALLVITASLRHGSPGRCHSLSTGEHAIERSIGLLQIAGFPFLTTRLPALCLHVQACTPHCSGIWFGVAAAPPHPTHSAAGTCRRPQSAAPRAAAAHSFAAAAAAAAATRHCQLGGQLWPAAWCYCGHSWRRCTACEHQQCVRGPAGHAPAATAAAAAPAADTCPPLGPSTGCNCSPCAATLPAT